MDLLLDYCPVEVFKRQNVFSKLVHLKIFIQESTWSWSQVIWTSPFCAILVQNLDYFWPFQGGLECLKSKNKVTFVTEPRKVCIVKVTLFLHFEHSNPLKWPNKSKFWDQNRAKRTSPNDLGPRPS